MRSEKDVDAATQTGHDAGLMPIPAALFCEYLQDAWQRSVLFLDVLQERSRRYEEHASKPAPHVLKFAHELVMDGRMLRRPVNYLMVRILPSTGVATDPKKRPFVIADPRAGHGPGIGGFKPQSEIGVALAAGHPCYFVGFLPRPIEGQTIDDVVQAEIAFLERVIELHPEAEGKPAVIGNCQAGWSVMMAAAQRPDLFGPIIAAGAPLSYWAGVHGKNPMRYLAGLLGGSWLTAMTGDLGHGKFDGAWLVSNFESQNPSNTYWTKQYNLYSKVDSEAPRYLDFEQWWGGHVELNADEMQFIVDNLFIGNKLSSGALLASNGTRIDLRAIRSPIIVFCSKGDNVTPPQQALGWILDLYSSIEDIRAHGQTIIYAVHDSIGHLGIFVSGSVAKKEHEEFASNIDLIDVMPPGLYEAVLRPKDPNDPTAELVEGDYLVSFETRTLDDIRAFGENSIDDERKFAAAARVSEINLSLYRTFLQPWVRLAASDGLARWLSQMHPVRLQYELFARTNPWLAAVSSLADRVREQREPIAKDNPFWNAQEQVSTWVETSLDAYRDVRDHMAEELFHAVYGAPLVQAVTGVTALAGPPRQRPGADVTHQQMVQRKLEDLRARISDGGPREAAIRAMLYVRLPDGVSDERAFTLLRRMRDEAGGGIPLREFKRIVREQFFLLMLDSREAIDALPDMLARDPEQAAIFSTCLERLVETVKVRSEVAKQRYAQVLDIFQQAATGSAEDMARPERRREASRRSRS